MRRKSPALAIALTLGLGGFGLLYVARRAGIALSALTALGLFGTHIAFRLSLLFLAAVWIVSTVWAALATDRFNFSLMSGEPE